MLTGLNARTHNRTGAYVTNAPLSLHTQMLGERQKEKANHCERNKKEYGRARIESVNCLIRCISDWHFACVCARVRVW